jgi:hypothetical protein
MAYTTINKSTEHFDTKVYTGNGTSQTLDMDNLGLLWMKNRTETSNHNLFDVVRGGYYISDPGPNLRTNNTTAGHGSDITSAYGITFDSSSSTIGSDGGGYNYNQSGKSYVGWQWRANGAGVSNTDGDVTATVSANQTSGFSIVKYVNPASGSPFTVGHGLGSAPKMIIIKNTSGVQNWGVWHTSIGFGNYLILNTTAATGAANLVTATSATTFSTYQDHHSTGVDLIAYCFAEKKGFSKFGSYTGNGSADGTFVYTGFKPAFIMVKRTDTSTWGWNIWDSKRLGYNGGSPTIFADLSNSEDTEYDRMDQLSNGFKCRINNGQLNASGGSYIYMAFASEPLVSTAGVPCTAR